MSRTIYFPSVSTEVLVSLLGIGCSFLIPEVRQFVGLEKEPMTQVTSITPASPYPATRRLPHTVRLPVNKPYELFPNFFITYLPKPKEEDGGTIWVAPGNWAGLRFDAEGQAGEKTISVSADEVVRHHGDYQDTLFVVTEVTPEHLTIR